MESIIGQTILTYVKVMVYNKNYEPKINETVFISSCNSNKEEWQVYKKHKHSDHLFLLRRDNILTETEQWTTQSKHQFYKRVEAQITKIFDYEN